MASLMDFFLLNMGIFVLNNLNSLVQNSKRTKCGQCSTQFQKVLYFRIKHTIGVVSADASISLDKHFCDLGGEGNECPSKEDKTVRVKTRG
jgi:hypothetical protein